MIVISNLYARRGSFSLVDISFTIQNESFLVIMGPNGCGKTTLLECIAGLCKVSSGKIIVDDVDITNLPPERRRVGYVPSDYALFPGMTVERNILLAFKKSKKMRLEDLRRILHILQIEDLMKKKVECLSSGQKQRAAIARALAAEPNVLLLDEPCSALDPPTKEAFRRGINDILKDIFHELSIPVIYTTHDILEASLVGDKIAIMKNGKIEQIGSLKEVFEEPRSRFIAEFLGYNVLSGSIISANESCISIKVGDETLVAGNSKSHLEPSREVLVIIKPQDISLTPMKEGINPKWGSCQCNVLKGVLKSLSIEGFMAKAEVMLSGFSLKAEINLEYIENFHIGDSVFVHIKDSKVKVIPKHVET